MKKFMMWLKEKNKLLKVYLPDILIFVGVFFFSTSYFREEDNFCFSIRSDCTHPNWGVVIGIMIIVIGVDILARRYFLKKKS